MTTGLIIGYGRAGRRHAKLLDELGIDWFTFDPLLLDAVHPLSFPSPETLEEALSVFEAEPGDFAVIATPPDLHLSQIRKCLDAGLPVLCEKPLCGLGQLGEAEALLRHPGAGKVMVAYNWRYNPGLIAFKDKICQHVALYARQDREIPAWGLLLDHCSHDLDIMRFLRGDFEIYQAEYLKLDEVEKWEITGKQGDGQIFISERIRRGSERKAELYTDDDNIDLDPDPAMYTAMWTAFLSGRYEPGLAEAIETQRLLERCEELAR